MLASTAATTCPVQNDFHRYSHLGQAKQHVQKQFRGHCTWKCIGIVFIALSVILLFLISYFIGKIVCSMYVVHTLVINIATFIIIVGSFARRKSKCIRAFAAFQTKLILKCCQSYTFRMYCMID